MGDQLPAGLLEACVLVGAVGEKLKDVCELQQRRHRKDLLVLEAEVLQVHAPPFVWRESARESQGRLPRRRSFIKKKREKAAPVQDSPSGQTEMGKDASVPVEVDLVALPQLCFPDGLQVTTGTREDMYHFLVFTDVFGNQSHGVVVQYQRRVEEAAHLQNGHSSSSRSLGIFCTFAICLISKHPYYNALRDSLSCLMLQLRSCRQQHLEERVKEFAARLALVPVPPPGQLLVAFNLRALEIVLPSREHRDQPVVDLDLHLPFLCFQPKKLLEIISSLLTEQRVVFFSADRARLTLTAQCFMLYIQPLLWQHPFVPILSCQMLDFLMAPTAFLMGCHLRHLDEVAAETDDLVLINIDNGMVTASSQHLSVPIIPLAAEQQFLQRSEALQIHYDLDVCSLGTGTDVNELRRRRQQWQNKLNGEIQSIALELMVNIFREVLDHLSYEHRVFNSEEFLKSRNPEDQNFYEKVLDTHIFHCFLKERLNRKLDAFARLEQSTRSEVHRAKAMTDTPRRPTIHEMVQKFRKPLDGSLRKQLGQSMPNLEEESSVTLLNRQISLRKLSSDSAVTLPPKPVRIFKLPEFPPPLSYHYVQNYYSELIVSLGKAITWAAPGDSTMQARYHYLRGLLNSTAGRHLDALSDFQHLYKTDMDIFPAELVRSIVDSLSGSERGEAERRPELKRLISRVHKEREKEQGGCQSDSVKRFELPRKHMLLEDFVRRVQESGIVRDVATIHRLFDALTVESRQGGDTAARPRPQSVFYVGSQLDGQQKQVDPELFRIFYTLWKETEAEAQDVHLPAAVLEHLDNSECVYKLSSSIKTSRGVGKIAMTQRRLFLLTEGRPIYVEITRFRDIEEVKISSTPFVLLRVPSLKIKSRQRKETFEANLKSECDLWNLMIKEMWAGRKMADEHKDPQYMQQALTNALLMDAVVRCLQSHKAIFAATKLAYFDRMKLEVPMMVPKTTSETLKHKINPSAELATPQAVDVLLYTPGQLSFPDADGGGNPKLWCCLSGGKVVVFDAASWSIQHNCIQVGIARLNCMLGVDQHQVWIGSRDSVVYIINTHSMSCNKQLTEHRAEVTGLALGELCDRLRQTLVYSCDADGSVLVWDASTLRVKKHFQMSCTQLQAVQIVDGTVWCCAQDCVLELRKNGDVHRRVCLPSDPVGTPSPSLGCFLLLGEKEQLWTGYADAGELCLWHCRDLTEPIRRVTLPDCSGVVCMIKVKQQIWVGGRAEGTGTTRGKIYVVDVERCSVEKELVAHADAVQTLCSAEDRYVLSGAAGEDGKIAIWKVE